MDFDKYKEINDNRQNYREIHDATIISHYKNTGCGDGYRIFLNIEKDKIADASYTTTGCGFSVVALEMATEWSKNKSLQEIKNLTADELDRMFSFPDRRKNYPESAVAAIHQAIEDYESGNIIPPSMRINSAKAFTILAEKGNLQNENLSGISLEGQNLAGVDFSGANLHNAYLQNSNLKGANFSGANLKGAFLNNTDLIEACFDGADLRWCKLSGAKLEGATFKAAIYDIGTRVDNVNLHIFKEMIKKGKEAYVFANEQDLIKR